MANSDAGTSSGYARGGKYQVFLSFCGRDTRKGFTSVLHRDLRNNGIHAFIDNEELRVGEEIGGALLQAIDDSQIYIPIFSQNYASSKWCLRELAKMVDNTPDDSEKKKILPVFYDVEPKDVNPENSSLYETAIKEHEGKFPREVESWEKALKKVDKIKGWELSKCEDEAELLDSVVKAALQELKIREKFVTEDLVGLDGRVADVMKWLDVNSSDKARLLVIHGMGGVGKSTLAKVIYNELYSRFGKCCAFLDDIRETSKKEGLVSLQKKLLTEMDSSSAAKIIRGVDDGRNTIERTLGSKKALIVLDDVDEKNQIENLIGQDRLHPGARIIITTRNTNVQETNSDHALQILPYEMEEMNFDHALQLFKKHAFFEGSLVKDFERLSRDIVFTTGGLPLALEVIGSFLFRKPKEKWEDTLNQLQKMSRKCVKEKLMISYEALDCPQREIFLDIACFFINEDMMNANYMWEACGFDPNWVIDVLVEMSLIKIKDDERFWMHDQLRDLGREIVRRGNPENVKKWSRVWTSKEFLDFVRTEETYEDVEALDLQGVSSPFLISHEEIKRFKNLRFLRLSGEILHGDFIVSLPKLRWIHSASPLYNLGVPSVHSKNLVVLELFNQRLEDSKIWDLIKMATKLKILAFEECSGLTRTPDLSGCLDLERLTFKRCEDLKEIDGSIGSLVNLVELHVGSGSLQVVPNLSKLTNLEDLSLYDSPRDPSKPRCECDLGWVGRLSKLKRLSLYFLNFTAPALELGLLSLLEHFTLRGLDLQPLKQLPPLHDFSSTGSSLSNLKVLSDLSLYDSQLQEIQLSVLSQLQHLQLICCELRSLSIPSSLQSLRVTNCPNMFEIQFVGMSASLMFLSITACGSIGRIVLGGDGGSLGVPNQSESFSIESTDCSPRVLHLTNAFKKLERIDLFSCKNLLEIQVIGALSSLQVIKIEFCDAMEEFSGVSNLKNLHHLYIGGHSKLRVVEGLNKLESLTWLSVDECSLLGTWFDILNSKIPDVCRIQVRRCCESHGYLPQQCCIFKQCKKWAKKKAQIKGNAEEPSIGLQLQLASSQDHDSSKEPPTDSVKEGFLLKNQNQMRQQDSNPLSISPLSSTKPLLQCQPFASSRDHEINEEPPIDDVREGTTPGNQNQTRERDSNTQSHSPLSTKLQHQSHPSASSRGHEINEEPSIDDVKEGTPPGNQNQTMEQDSNPQSLDGPARPRIFCDRFKTCLVSILECVCNRDFP